MDILTTCTDECPNVFLRHIHLNDFRSVRDVEDVAQARDVLNRDIRPLGRHAVAQTGAVQEERQAVVRTDKITAPDSLRRRRTMTELIPLSPFASIPGRRWTAPPLSPNKYDPDTLERLIRYLENCPMILAWMGYTEDLIGGRFNIAGGSATMSDGK